MKFNINGKIVDLLPSKEINEISDPKELVKLLETSTDIVYSATIMHRIHDLNYFIPEKKVKELVKANKIRLSFLDNYGVKSKTLKSAIIKAIKSKSEFPYSMFTKALSELSDLKDMEVCTKKCVDSATFTNAIIYLNNNFSFEQLQKIYISVTDIKLSKKLEELMKAKKESLQK